MLVTKTAKPSPTSQTHIFRLQHLKLNVEWKINSWIVLLVSGEKTPKITKFWTYWIWFLYYSNLNLYWYVTYSMSCLHDWFVNDSCWLYKLFYSLSHVTCNSFWFSRPTYLVIRYDSYLWKNWLNEVTICGKWKIPKN